MVRLNSDESNPDELERIARAPDVVRNGWKRTIEEVRAMADAREEEGYETLTVFAADTATVAPGDVDEDRWGLSYLVDSDDAETVTEFDERTDFDETAVYQNQSGGNVFIATECIDLDNEAILVIACGWPSTSSGRPPPPRRCTATSGRATARSSPPSNTRTPSGSSPTPTSSTRTRSPAHRPTRSRTRSRTISRARGRTIRPGSERARGVSPHCPQFYP
jgi:hypothetical protein